MTRLDVRSTSRDYTVLVASGLLPTLGRLLDREGLARPRSLVTDLTVGQLYGRDVAHALGLDTIELPSGETGKAWPAVDELCRRWIAAGLDRSAAVLAVGGGVVTDTAGFAAAVFMRGIDWIAAPTTLLGMVDAAIGGKTGINLAAGKNLVGAFWPPRLVVADVETLATLPTRELRAGLAELVKAAWIGDRGLLDLLPGTESPGYSALTPEGWEALVARAVAVKIDIVARDEREAGRRKVLNLGHTLGHALEAATAYERFLHGEAVAWGIHAAALLGRRRDVLGDHGEAALRNAVHRLGPLPSIADLDADSVCAFIAADKKRGAGGVGWVLPTDDGVLTDQPVDIAEAVDVLRELQRGS